MEHFYKKTARNIEYMVGKAVEKVLIRQLPES
jgi:hypothetical protein